MAVIFQPGRQAVFMALLPQPADIIIRDTVGDEPAKIPKETVGDILAPDNRPMQNRKIRKRIVTIGLLETLRHIVGPILPSGLVTILHNHFEGPAILCRNTAQYLSDKGIEMARHMLLAHLIDLKPQSLGAGRTVRHGRRTHGQALHPPFPGRDFPTQRSVAETCGNILHCTRIDRQRFLYDGLRFPKIVMPHGKRRLEHLCKRLFREAFHLRKRRQHSFKNSAARRRNNQPVSCRKCFGKGDDDRGQRVKPDVHLQIASVDGKPLQQPVSSVFPAVKLRRRKDRPVRPNRKATHRLLSRHVPVQTQLLSVMLHRPFRIAFGRPGQWIGDDPHILRISPHLREGTLEQSRAFDNGLRRRQITHALLRFDPGTSRLTPPGTVKNTDLYIEFPGTLQRSVHHTPPLRRKELMLPIRLIADANVADKGTVDTDLLHGLEVPNHPFLGDVVRHPVPVDGQRRFIGHTPERITHLFHRRAVAGRFTT